MIRVCHIITKLELGGAQCNTLYTISHLDRSRFEASLVTGGEGLLVDEARRSGVRAHFVDAMKRELSPVTDAKALMTLTGILRREKPDIVHTHSSKAGILGRWAALLAGVPHIVHTVHGYGFHPGQSRVRRRFYVSLEKLTGHLATSAFVTVSRANLEEGVALGLFTRDRVSLIRSGIRLSDYSPPSSRPDPPEHLTVGMVACLKPQKAPLDFVRVAGEVLSASDRPRVKFVLVGDGELRGRVEGEIRERGLSRDVFLAGWRHDIPELMREFDLLLHTSLWEGLPRVFPEAMATGLPIVATRVDGAPEAITEGVTGYLADPGDIGTLAGRTLELLRDAGLRSRMGKAALGRVEPWDIDEMVRRQERLYEGLVSGRAREGVSRSSQVETG